MNVFDLIKDAAELIQHDHKVMVEKQKQERINAYRSKCISKYGMTEQEADDAAKKLSNALNKQQ